MRAICVDDEPHVLQMVVSLCQEMPQLTEVTGFETAADALAYLNEQTTDLALLDIDMPDMNGIELAMRIKELQPDTAVLFLTGYSQYALEAFAVHASGYLLKPVNREKLASEVAYALRGHPQRMEGHIAAKTFGEFDLFVDGNVVSFPRAKAKELLAYLIDRQGSSVTRAAVFAALWEDESYDRSKQKYLDVIIRSLRDTLELYGAGELLSIQKGNLRIRPELLDCDLYRFISGDVDAINAYRGEYMNAYSWASISEAWVERKIGSK